MLQFNTPILYIVFNRLDTVKQTFPKIAEQKPKQLFIAADGPRANREGEAEKCKAVREYVLSHIDWECDVKTLFRDENLGCGENVHRAITWFFDNVEQGIILEDDCLPNNSFFKFCELMLVKYSDDNNVKLISGSNYLYGDMKIDGYFLSKFYYIWGWASWRRAWKEIDFDNNVFPSYEYLRNKLHDAYKDSSYENWLYSMIEGTYKFKIDTWDLKLVYSFLSGDGLVVTPFKNLISNVGYTSARTDEKSSVSKVKKGIDRTSPLEMPTFEIDFKKFNLNNDIENGKKAVKKTIDSVNFICKNIPLKDKIKKIIHICLKPVVFAVHVLRRIKWVISYKAKRDDDFLINVFDSDFEKKVLMSYITTPFTTQVLPNSHSNYYECQTAAKVFHELGYQVDVIHLFSKEKVDFSQYDVIYGQGQVFEDSFDYENYRKNQKHIMYGTGCCLYFSDYMTINSVLRFYKKTGLKAYSSSRVYEQGNPVKQFIEPDKIIVLGNDFTKSTFEHYELDKSRNRFVNLPAFYLKSKSFDGIDVLSEKNNKHFIWFGSGGLLHKGLDIVLDIFLKREDIILHVCGASKGEKEFWDYYEPLISNRKNIIIHGFIDVSSYEFRKLMQVCQFSIFPSVSEGGAVSIITVMKHGGLIPLVSPNIGLDVPEFVQFAEKIDCESYEKLIDHYLSLEKDVLLEYSRKIQQFVTEYYSFEKYENNLKRLISESLN